MEGGQEVRVDAEDEGGTEELNAANEPLQELEAEACLLTHDGGLLVVKRGGLEEEEVVGSCR